LIPKFSSSDLLLFLVVVSVNSFATTPALPFDLSEYCEIDMNKSEPEEHERQKLILEQFYDVSGPSKDRQKAATLLGTLEAEGCSTAHYFLMLAIYEYYAHLDSTAKNHLLIAFRESNDLDILSSAAARLESRGLLDAWNQVNLIGLDYLESKYSNGAEGQIRYRILDDN